MTKRIRTKEEKRRNARLGILIYIGVTAAALVLTISTGSCAGERYQRGNLTTLITGDERYARPRLTMCGFVRGVLPDTVDVVPCQFWNLMPLSGVAVIALGWLVRDLTGMRRSQ